MYLSVHLFVVNISSSKLKKWRRRLPFCMEQLKLPSSMPHPTHHFSPSMWVSFHTKIHRLGTYVCIMGWSQLTSFRFSFYKIRESNQNQLDQIRNSLIRITKLWLQTQDKTSQTKPVDIYGFFFYIYIPYIYRLVRHVRIRYLSFFLFFKLLNFDF